MGAVCLGNTQVASNAVIDKVQAYPTSETVKEVQAFVAIWGFWMTFNAHLAQCPHPYTAW